MAPLNVENHMTKNWRDKERRQWWFQMIEPKGTSLLKKNYSMYHHRFTLEYCSRIGSSVSLVGLSETVKIEEWLAAVH